MNIYYNCKIKKHISRLKQFKNINFCNYCYWIMNVYKFFFLYYVSIYIITAPGLFIGYTFIINILDIKYTPRRGWFKIQPSLKEKMYSPLIGYS